MKKLILNLHLCVGLIAALFLISLSLSGAIIAFEGELNRTFHPELTNVKPIGQPLNWDVFRARVEEQSPGWKLIRSYFPDQPNRSAYVRLRSVATRRIRFIYVNHYTGAILGSTEDGSNWIIKIHDLHVNLLTGKVGNRIVTWSTFGLLILSLSGRLMVAAQGVSIPAGRVIATLQSRLALQRRLLVVSRNVRLRHLWLGSAISDRQASRSSEYSLGGEEHARARHIDRRHAGDRSRSAS